MIRAMTNSGDTFKPDPDDTVRDAFEMLRRSVTYRERYPMEVREAFARVICWLPPRYASLPLAKIDAMTAKILRDKAGRERGYRFGNCTVFLLQSIIKEAVSAGALSTNRVKQVPKLLPPRRQLSNDRRSIKPRRNHAGRNLDLQKTRTSFV
jgi:hypothetical protein